MNLLVVYHEPHTRWTVFHPFKKYHEYLETIYPNVEFMPCNHRYDGNPGGLFSPHIMTIQNKDTKKYIIISYWDRINDIRHNVLDFKPENCIGIYTSAGVTPQLNVMTGHVETMNFIPFSYMMYSLDYEDLSLKSKPFELKENNNLHFRGYLYNERLQLKNLGEINITDEKLNSWDYYEELNNNKINLSLNGAAEICNRDIEILSTQSVLFRPILTQKFHNELIPNYHYVGFEYSHDTVKQNEIILNMYNEIKDNTEYLKFISQNGYEWYKNNGTVDSNFRILTEIVKLETLN